MNKPVAVAALPISMLSVTGPAWPADAPGVTAAGGCAAAAGIPLTHRDLANSCVFLPGHMAEGNSPLDWAALARPGQTRVFYMGVQRLAQIAHQLMAHGLPPDTPAAIVRDGTRASQTVFATSLDALVAQAPAYGRQPGLLIIGETVRLSPEFRPVAVRGDDHDATSCSWISCEARPPCK